LSLINPETETTNENKKKQVMKQKSDKQARACRRLINEYLMADYLLPLQMNRIINNN
jgi:hypothetical protein